MVAKPHGGRLVYRVARGNRREYLAEQAKELPKVRLGPEEAADVENICTGVYSPLEGFMVKEELESVLDDMRLPNDLPWTLPILLDATEEEVGGFGPGDSVALVDESGLAVAIMNVEEIYRFSKKRLAKKVFKTTDPSHPGVARVYEMGDYLLGGQVELINFPPNPFERYTLRPYETRVIFRERGWRTVVGFQTRNAPHMGHEYVQKIALAFVDGLFINPVVGRKKRGDFRDEAILRAYEALIDNYYPRETTVLGVVRYEMRYAGPREAVHHAIMRKNFGCTHFIVGRDHAGVGSYYGPYEAQEIFAEFPDLGITPLFFRELFYCRRCGGIVHDKICPHGEESRLRFSGTMIREMLMRGERPPREVMRPEVSDALLSMDDLFVG